MSSEPASPRRYHHGSLQAALLDLAEAALEAQGHETLSLRDLAAAAQVAPSAPYRHFASRDDLLEALAAAGFERLVARYREAAVQADPVRAVCEAYVAFSRAHPQLFRLMFVSDAVRRNADGPAMSAGLKSFAIFEEVFRARMADASADEVRLRVLTVWSALHGAALLASQGRLDPLLPGQLSTDDLIASVISLNAPR